MFNFKKKLFFVVLCTSLLILLLGLCGSCYASSLGQVKNLCYNFMVNQIGKTESDASTLIDNYDWSQITDYIGPDYTIFAVNDSSTTVLNVFLQTTNPGNKKNQTWTSSGKTKYSCFYTARFNVNNSGMTSATVVSPGTSSATLGYNGCIYSDLSIWNTAGNTIVHTGPYSYPDFMNLDGQYSVIWEFIPQSQQQVTIYGENNSFPSYVIDSGLQIHIGTVQNSSYVDGLYLKYYKYDKGTGRFVPYGNEQTWYSYIRDGFIYRYWPGTSTNHNTYYSTGLVLDNTNNYQNNIIRLHIKTNNPTLSDMYYYFYVENNNTVIQNGQVIPSLTFSGDYGNDYNNQNNDNIIQENHDDTINTITDDSEVNGLIDDFLNSGDLLNSIGGYNYFENPFIAFVEDLADSFVDVLTGSNNQSITINWRGTNYTFYATDFALPSGSLKTFISAICNAFFVWGIIKYGYQLYEWIRTGRVQNWLNNTSSGNIEDYFLF